LESERPQVSRPQAGRAPRISVIVPALNESARLERCLIRPVAQACEVIVVDGGSQDATASIAAQAGARVIQAPRGRAHQMNAGASAAHADLLLFLHADTELPPNWSGEVLEALRQGASWGRFDVRLDSPRASIGLVSFMMNWRSRLSGIATGDQAIFVSRALWLRAGGFAPIALMEDIELCRRLKRLGGAPACLRAQVTVSARRWQERGVLKTIVQMWRLRALYFFGASPDYLHRLYYGSLPEVTPKSR
jgi:rSAM/selenodomain-associated transferase 2